MRRQAQLVESAYLCHFWPVILTHKVGQTDLVFGVQNQMKILKIIIIIISARITSSPWLSWLQHVYSGPVFRPEIVTHKVGQTDPVYGVQSVHLFTSTLMIISATCCKSPVHNVLPESVHCKAILKQREPRPPTLNAQCTCFLWVQVQLTATIQKTTDIRNWHTSSASFESRFSSLQRYKRQLTLETDRHTILSYQYWPMLAKVKAPYSFDKLWQLCEHTSSINRVGQKLDCFSKFITPVSFDVWNRSTYRTVQFFIWSKTGMPQVTAFKYSLRNFSVTTLCLK